MTNLCLVVREEKLKWPVSDIESWELAHVRSNHKDGEGKYYDKTEENPTTYMEEYKWLHPDHLTQKGGYRREGGGRHRAEESWSGEGSGCCDHSFYLLHTAPSYQPEPAPAHEHVHD